MVGLLETAVRRGYVKYIILIHDYLMWRNQRYGRSDYRFSYEGLQNYCHRLKKRGRSLPHWHTIERWVRRLAELGYLDSWINRYGKAVFEPTSKFWQILEERRQVIVSVEGEVQTQKR